MSDPHDFLTIQKINNETWGRKGTPVQGALDMGALCRLHSTSGFLLTYVLTYASMFMFFPQNTGIFSGLLLISASSTQGLKFSDFWDILKKR